MPRGKNNVRKVKFSSAELSYEPPAEVDFGSGLVLQGMNQWREYRKWRKNVAVLEPEIRKAFPDDRAVNDALKRALRGSPPSKVAPIRRKSA